MARNVRRSELLDQPPGARSRGRPDDKWGESVHAIVVPREGANPSTEDLISHCRKLIADYKCPRSISYRKEALPLSGPGKVLKTELRKPFWEGKERQVN